MVLNDCATAAVSWPSAALPARMSSPPLEDLPTPAAATPRLAPPAAMFTTAPVRAQANFWMAPVSILSACCSIRSTICNPCAWMMLRLVRRCSAASLRITEANMAAGLGRATQPDRSPEFSPGDARSGSWLRTSLTAAVKSLPAWMASIRASSTLAALTPFAWACSSSLLYSTELYPVAFVMMVSILSPFSGIRPWPDCR